MRIQVLSIAVLLLAVGVPLCAQPMSDPTDLDFDGVPGVGSAPPGASMAPEVHALRGTGSILIDRTRGQDGDVSGFTDYVESQGWSVDTLQMGPVVEPDLTPYDIFLIPIVVAFPMPSFTPSEVLAITDFVASGGGLWLFHESTRDPTGINSVAEAFGVSYFEDFIRDPSDNEGQVFWPTIRLFTGHAITGGVSSYGFYGGCCLEVASPSVVAAMGDEDAYSSNCPTLPPTLATYESNGRVVFSGDMTPLVTTYYPERLRDEEELLLQNIANWLARLDESTATAASSWGTLKRLFR
jgi:hypothetical protein